MKTDEEIKKNFHLEKQAEDLIFIEFFDTETDEAGNGRQAELMVEAIMKEVNKNTKINYKFLVDLTKAGTVTYMAPRAREVYAELPSFSNLDKAAVVGNSLVLEVMVNLLMQASGRASSFKWFKDIEEARKWLSSG